MSKPRIPGGLVHKLSADLTKELTKTRGVVDLWSDLSKTIVLLSPR